MPCFLHGGLLHLLCNCYFLWQLGPYCQGILGGRRFLSLYLLTAITGSLGSLSWNYYSHTGGAFWAIPGSIGASTSMFGLLGFLLLWSRRTPGAEGMNRSLLFCLGINLYLGFTLSFIDNAGHIGGLLGGLLFALAFCQRRSQAWHRALLGPGFTIFLATAAIVSVLTVPILYFGEFGQTCRTLYQVRSAVRSLHSSAEVTPAEYQEYAEDVAQVIKGLPDDFPVSLDSLEFRLRFEGKLATGKWRVDSVTRKTVGDYPTFLEKYLSYLTWTSGLSPIRP